MKAFISGDVIVGYQIEYQSMYIVPSVIRRRAANKDKETFSQSEDEINKMLNYYRLRSKPNEIVQPAGNVLPSSKSSIGSHLIENPSCGDSYDPSCSKILVNGRSKYHVDVLEGVFISTLKPNLCNCLFVYYGKITKRSSTITKRNSFS